VPPDLVDTASLRFDTGSLTVQGLLRTIGDDETIAAAVAGRAFVTKPKLLDGLGRIFEHRLERPAVVIFYGRRP